MAGAPPTVRVALNSDVLPLVFVAVAVISRPVVTATGKLTIKLALPELSVSTVWEPRYSSPSSLPDELA